MAYDGENRLVTTSGTSQSYNGNNLRVKKVSGGTFDEAWYDDSDKWKFTGYERDPETGLAYAFACYYNPRLGRFTSSEPVGGTIGDPQTLDRYAYVRNSPTSLIDPLGLDGCSLGSDGVIHCTVTAQGDPFLTDFFFSWFFRGPRGDFPRERPDKPDREYKPEPRPPAPQSNSAQRLNCAAACAVEGRTRGPGGTACPRKHPVRRYRHGSCYRNVARAVSRFAHFLIVCQARVWVEPILHLSRERQNRSGQAGQ